MTTIVFDGLSVAADRLACAGDMLCKGPVVKLVISDDKQRLYGITGCLSNFVAWIKWFEVGANPEKLPAASDNDCFLVFHRSLEKHQHRAYRAKTPYGELIDERDAWGSGCDFAIGALDAGLSARDCVIIASGRDKSSGNGVLAYDLYTMSWIGEDAHTAGREVRPKPTGMVARADR